MTGDSWDAYWRNARSAAAHQDGGPQDEVLEQFWTRLFRQVFPNLQTGASLLDIACGNGAVPRFALATATETLTDKSIRVYGVDESAAALQEMRKRHASLGGIAANALHLPFRNAEFDLVSSQFGMEYAGTDVFIEVARVLRPGGILAAVLHLHEGGIYRECEANLQAIDGFRGSGILACFAELFRALLPARTGAADKARLETVDRQFAAAVVAAEAVLRQWGKNVASGTLLRIYTDIGHMYRRLHAYDADELFNWIEVMSRELDTYSGRMSSMLAAALDDKDFQLALARLEGEGLKVRVRDTLAFGRQEQVSAWVVVLEKGSTTR